VQTGQLPIVRFGDFDGVALAQFHHDVEEIHRIEFELIPQRHITFQVAEVLIGRDHRDDLQHRVFDLLIRHRSASPDYYGDNRAKIYTNHIRFTTTTELIPSMPDEL